MTFTSSGVTVRHSRNPLPMGPVLSTCHLSTLSHLPCMPAQTHRVTCLEPRPNRTPAGVDPLQPQPSVADVVSQLLSAHCFDEAHRLACAAWPAGSAQLTEGLEALVASMAAHAARLQVKGGAGRD